MANLQQLSKSFIIRELANEDLPFILNSFHLCLKQYKSSFLKGYTFEEIKNFLESAITWALSHPQYSIFIVCSQKDSNKIISYIIANPKTNTIFFNYTKHIFRKIGIQREMLLPLVVTNSKPIYVNWATERTLEYRAKGKCEINHNYILELMKEDMHNRLKENVHG